ncbi:MAG: phosphatase [Lachnospiraceae bacterium]|nr:phosphatase [Lachnospiraceae bacterium]
MIDVLDIHTHTLASGHAYNTIYEMAAQARTLGLEVLGITEHAPTMPGTCHEFYFNNLKVVPRVINGQKLLLGTELNILNAAGNLDLTKRTLKEMDVCVASIHPPCFQKERNIESVTRAYLNVCENPYVTIIGHPDDGRFPVDYEQLAIKARDTKTLLELNQGSLRPGGIRKNTRENAKILLHYCEKYGTPVILNSDAHVVTELGNHSCAAELIAEMNFPQELIVNQSLEEFAKFLYKKPEWL